MKSLERRVLFGAAYYYEYQPPHRLGSRELERDFRLMREAGFTVIRVGESVWSTWEPTDGQFELDWLQPVLDAASNNGIGVILGTPTYALPMWLAQKHPEINVDRSTGHPMGWGARQEINYAHPAFVRHAERVILKIVGRYVDHPALIGFQVDNEPGNELFHNADVFEKFVEWLRARYGTVDRLNDEWGLTYWSHRLSSWDDVWKPDANLQPQYDLAWRRFQASITTSFIGWQADVIREQLSVAGREDLFVTTCMSYERPTLQDDELAEQLDIGAGNPYYRMQDGLELPDHREFDQHWTTSGVWALYATADRMYASRQAPFLVTETNAGAIGMAWSNEPAFDGQWRQAAWALVSRGATMIEYWHWHTLHYGAETYWGGILPHSQEPGRVYTEIARIGADFAAAGDRVTELKPESDVAILFSNESKWALEEHPALSASLGGPPIPNTRSYQTVVDAFVRGAFDAGHQVNFVHPRQLMACVPAAYAAAHPVLVAAAFTVARDEELGWLKAYAESGGHLVLGIRTGFEDEEARARLDRKPALLHEAAGVRYDEFSNLSEPLPVVTEHAMVSTGFTAPASARATLWADSLIAAEGTEVLLSYDHPHFGRYPVVTTRNYGAGRITYVGTVPNLPLAQSIVDWAVEAVAERPGALWKSSSLTQTVTGASNRHGERIRFVHNWSWGLSEFTIPGPAEDVLSGERFSTGQIIQLDAWDVRIFAEIS
ncbi:beta-galactosidase [Microbacterium sp.]|uniref:beta-galactosidase n=1 Tax=Microbacterium sp. TaxID=51671 RepID=UPI003A90E58F